MNITLTIVLKDAEWGFSDLLDGRELNHKTKEEVRDLVIERTKEDYNCIIESDFKIEKL
jgi:hypothetical protein